jgi:hypothetical protein
MFCPLPARLLSFAGPMQHYGLHPDQAMSHEISRNWGLPTPVGNFSILPNGVRRDRISSGEPVL